MSNQENYETAYNLVVTAEMDAHELMGGLILAIQSPADPMHDTAKQLVPQILPAFAAVSDNDYYDISSYLPEIAQYAPDLITEALLLTVAEKSAFLMDHLSEVARHVPGAVTETVLLQAAVASSLDWRSDPSGFAKYLPTLFKWVPNSITKDVCKAGDTTIEAVKAKAEAPVVPGELAAGIKRLARVLGQQP